ncbi:maleylacetate reductase [Gordonia desulfuricans]
MEFVHVTNEQRVLFGRGQVTRHLRDEVDRIGARKPLLIASARDSGLVERMTAVLPPVVRIDEVRQHVPIENAERARLVARESGADVLIAVGGGSATGLAKAIALTGGQPIIAVPTTYSGSEGTDMWGLTENGTKTTGIDSAVLPVSVIYDADLAATLPIGLAVASGLNALAHCVDALWAPRADPINQALALEATRALSAALRDIAGDSPDIDGEEAAAGRETAFYGTYLSAVAFASAGSGLHHKICHVLGGTFDMPHAQTHAVVLPYVLALNAPKLPALSGRLAEVLGHRVDDRSGAPHAVQALEALRTDVAAPRSLAALGLRADDIPEAVGRVVAIAPPSNPAPVTSESIDALLRAAWAGTPATELRPSV